jgi:hypothetical protein
MDMEGSERPLGVVYPLREEVPRGRSILYPLGSECIMYQPRVISSEHER